jgi:TetR/AcrR family transcriptional regulator, cholesterol catabolism regulator
LNQNLFPLFPFYNFALIMTETRTAIIQRTEILFFKYGIKSVTMDDIARELGISKKTLYQFFENKNDLLTHVLKEAQDRDLERMTYSFTHSHDAIDEILKMAKHIVAELSKLMSAQTVLYDLKKYYHDLWQHFEQNMSGNVYNSTKQNLERGKKEGFYRADVDSDIIAKLYVSKMMSFVDEDMFPSKNYDKVKLFTQYLVYHIRGVATAKGLKKLDEQLETFLKNT